VAGAQLAYERHADVPAVATAVAVPVIVVFFLGQRRLVEGISMTGIKG
jgi:ABC-type glycerol-3-phosphate transport system permease component